MSSGCADRKRNPTSVEPTANCDPMCNPDVSGHGPVLAGSSITAATWTRCDLKEDTRLQAPDQQIVPATHTNEKPALLVNAGAGFRVFVRGARARVPIVARRALPVKAARRMHHRGPDGYFDRR